jgi:hypothetical protein
MSFPICNCESAQDIVKRACNSIGDLNERVAATLKEKEKEKEIEKKKGVTALDIVKPLDNEILPPDSKFDTILYTDGRVRKAVRMALSPLERIALIGELCSVMRCTLKNRVYFGEYVIHMYSCQMERHGLHGYVANPLMGMGMAPNILPADDAAPIEDTPKEKPKEKGGDDAFDGNDPMNLKVEYLYSLLPAMRKCAEAAAIITLRRCDGSTMVASPQLEAIYEAASEYVGENRCAIVPRYMNTY